MNFLLISNFFRFHSCTEASCTLQVEDQFQKECLLEPLCLQDYLALALDESNVELHLKSDENVSRRLFGRRIMIALSTYCNEYSRIAQQLEE